MPRKQKSVSKKYKKGGDNTSSSTRNKRRQEIREKTAAAAERRRSMQTFRQSRYNPRPRRNLRKYLTMDRQNTNTNIMPLEYYEVNECIGVHCGYLNNPRYMADIKNRALRRRKKDLLMSELNSRIIPDEIREGEYQYRMSKNRRNDLPFLDKDLQNKITDFMYRD